MHVVAVVTVEDEQFAVARARSAEEAACLVGVDLSRGGDTKGVQVMSLERGRIGGWRAHVVAELLLFFGGDGCGECGVGCVDLRLGFGGS